MRSRSGVWNRRGRESLGLLLVGDGVLATVAPENHCLLWLRGPSGWRRMVSFFADHPALTRAIGVAEAGTGLWLASRQWS
jgi:hypothetical protein